MQWTVRLETRTSAGEVTTTELATFSRPAMIGTLVEIGLVFPETKTLSAKLQASMLCGQVAAYASVVHGSALELWKALEQFELLSITVR